VVNLVIGCGDSTAQNEPGSSTPGFEVRESKKGNPPSGTWEKLVMHPFRDAEGEVVVEMPLPATWKIMGNPKQGEPTIVGPNGIKIIDFPGQNFIYTGDLRMQQTYRAAGQPLRAMPGVESLIQQDLTPWCARQGLRFVRQYDIPEVSRIDQWYNEQLYKAVPSQMHIQAIGTDWVSANGDPYFILMHLTAGQSANLLVWYYRCTGLQAEKGHFEMARKQLIFGLANARYNLKPIMAYNQKEAEKAGRSWAAHNERMARNQADFEASQRAFINRSTAAHDSLMRNWQERNAASDKSQERFVDTITERTKVVDPSSGQQYKVESGSNHYWMNSDGRYLSTDKQDYDPNLDRTLNNQKWQELKKVDE
jgi:hypothetical protein